MQAYFVELLSVAGYGMLSPDEADDSVDAAFIPHDAAADHVLQGAAVVLDHGPADEHLHGHVPDGRADRAAARAADELVPHVAGDHDLLVAVVGRGHGHEGADDQPFAQRRDVDRPAALQPLARQHPRGYGII